LPTTLTTLYTCPNGRYFQIRSITVVNQDDSNELTWYLYIVPSGDSAASANLLVPGTKQWNVPAGKNIDYDTWKSLSPSDSIQGYCNGTASIHIDGALVDNP
jgi:hypothetical protein